MKPILLLLFAAAVMSAADPADAVKQADKDWGTGVTKPDFALLEKVLGDDLIYTHSNGNTDTKKTYIESLKSGKAKYFEVTHESMEVRMYGKFALLTGKISVKVLSNGQPTPMKMSILHVYEKRKGQWQLIAHQSARLAQ
jgi:ketosteroid isomerase-like protein